MTIIVLTLANICISYNIDKLAGHSCATQKPPEKYSERKIFISKDVLISLVSMLGTVIGTFGGILTSSKLTSFRLEQLERKVDKHNNFASRIPVVEEQIKVINHRIDDLEKGGKNI